MFALIKELICQMARGSALELINCYLLLLISLAPFDYSFSNRNLKAFLTYVYNYMYAVY